MVRPDSPADDAVPNANGVMVKNAAALWAITGEERFESIGTRILRAHARAVAANVFSCASLLCGMDHLQRLATVTTADAALAAAARASGHPAAVVLAAPPPGHPAREAEVPPGRAVVCRHGACSLPLADGYALRAALWAPD